MSWKKCEVRFCALTIQLFKDSQIMRVGLLRVSKSVVGFWSVVMAYKKIVWENA